MSLKVGFADCGSSAGPSWFEGKRRPSLGTIYKGRVARQLILHSSTLELFSTHLYSLNCYSTSLPSQTKMKITNFLFVVSSVAHCAVAAPAPAMSPDISFDGSDVPEEGIQRMLATAIAGTVTLDDQGNIIDHQVHSEDNSTLVERQDNIPTVCFFVPPNTQVYNYEYRHVPDITVGFPNKKGSFCVGWNKKKTGDPAQPRDTLARDFIISSMNKQITKDGQFKSSKANNWLATFFLGTTAFADRDPRVFRLSIRHLWPEGDYIQRSSTFVSSLFRA